MASIVTIQRWFRTLLQRRQFLRITWATETLQVLIYIYFFRNLLILTYKHLNFSLGGE